MNRIADLAPGPHLTKTKQQCLVVNAHGLWILSVQLSGLGWGRAPWGAGDAAGARSTKGQSEGLALPHTAAVKPVRPLRPRLPSPPHAPPRLTPCPPLPSLSLAAPPLSRGTSRSHECTAELDSPAHLAAAGSPRCPGTWAPGHRGTRPWGARAGRRQEQEPGGRWVRATGRPGWGSRRGRGLCALCKAPGGEHLFGAGPGR